MIICDLYPQCNFFLHQLCFKNSIHVNLFSAFRSLWQSKSRYQINKMYMQPGCKSTFFSGKTISTLARSDEIWQLQNNLLMHILYWLSHELSNYPEDIY